MLLWDHYETLVARKHINRYLTVWKKKTFLVWHYLKPSNIEVWYYAEHSIQSILDNNHSHLYDPAYPASSINLIWYNVVSSKFDIFQAVPINMFHLRTRRGVKSQLQCKNECTHDAEPRNKCEVQLLNNYFTDKKIITDNVTTYIQYISKTFHCTLCEIIYRAN